MGDGHSTKDYELLLSQFILENSMAKVVIAIKKKPTAVNQNETSSLRFSLGGNALSSSTFNFPRRKANPGKITTPPTAHT